MYNVDEAPSYHLAKRMNMYTCILSLLPLHIKFMLVAAAICITQSIENRKAKLHSLQHSTKKEDEWVLPLLCQSPRKV